MTDISKEAVDVLLQGVTEGPWHVGRGDGQWFVGGGGFARVDMTGPLGDHEANALFIAAARELVPAQADKIEAQAAEIAALRAALAEAEEREAKLLADIVVKGGTSLSPTQDAYEAACRAIEKHRTRAKKAEAEIARLNDHIEGVALDTHKITVGLVKERDAANALLRDGLLTVQTGRNEPLVIWSETVAAHLGDKP